jgi:transcription elongation GreA/GreB family factor
VSKAFTSEETAPLPDVQARPPPHDPKPLEENEVERLRAEGAARLGATVVLAGDQSDVGSGEVLEYRLVAEQEADLKKGRLSVDSPLGRAILGKHEGEEVRFVRPKGSVEYELLAVKY